MFLCQYGAVCACLYPYVCVYNSVLSMPMGVFMSGLALILSPAQVGGLALDSQHLDPQLPDTGRPEPGWEDELRGGEAPAADDQHRPE